MNEPNLTVIGNLVADPEPRVSQSGKAWVTFRIASTPRVKDRQSGEYVDGEALWLGCRAFGDLADHITRSLSKGVRVIVQGRLSQRSYTDNQGTERTSLDLEVDAIGPELRFATATVQRTQRGGSGGGSTPPASVGSSDPWNGAQTGAQGFGGGFTDDEQPF